ncbi:hypothetical protein FPZ49_26125 [Paenibacillus cremeus]|uniref:Uncharacterized protein n=1 Tax=Paenibacillus cremeus TaxID=2163881 RepID=A0A559K4K8_9BACL|nr:hypothetical protein FPZ49_26125 [Paenibacillus cremeus]
MEAIFIALTLGLSSNVDPVNAHAINIMAVLVVLAAGLILRNPLATVPEYTMRFIASVTWAGHYLVRSSSGLEW